MNDNLREQQIESPQQGEPAYRHAEIGEIADIGEIERKIKDTEASLRQASGKITGAWIALIGSSIIIVPICIKYIGTEMFWIAIVGSLYLALNIWRIYSGEKQKKELECVLRGLGDKKGQLQASLAVEG